MVYVNRGFVPDADNGEYSPPPEGATVVSGVVRSPESGNWLTPSADLEKRVFFSRDPVRIAAATGLPEQPLGFFVDLDASYTPSTGLPQAGETRTVFPNSHLGYAVTWYGLAAALVGVFGVFAWGRLRGSDTGPRLTPPGAPS